MSRSDAVCVSLCVWMLTRLAQIVTAVKKRLIILCAQTHLRTLIANPKLGQSDVLYRSKLPAEKFGVNRHFQAS